MAVPFVVIFFTELIRFDPQFIEISKALVLRS